MRSIILHWLQELLQYKIPIWIVPDQTTLIGLGFLLSAAAAIWRAQRAQLNLRNVAMGLGFSFLGALLGARFLGVVLHLDQLFRNPVALLTGQRSGAVSFGALMGACISYAIYAKRAKINLWKHADAITPAAGIGLFFARLGCFIQGCDYGRMTGWSWGFRYPAPAPAYKRHLTEGFIGPFQHLSLPVHPLQLLLAGLSLCIFFFFALSSRAPRRPGDHALLAGSFYFCGRFLIEFLRSPHTSPMVALLNVAQWLCILGLLVLYGVRRYLQPSAPESLQHTLTQ